jgi:hypothetical protein
MTLELSRGNIVATFEEEDFLFDGKLAGGANAMSAGVKKVISASMATYNEELNQWVILDTPLHRVTIQELKNLYLTDPEQGRLFM